MSLIASIKIKSIYPPGKAKGMHSIMVRSTIEGDYWIDQTPLNPEECCKTGKGAHDATWRQVLCS